MAGVLHVSTAAGACRFASIGARGEKDPMTGAQRLEGSSELMYLLMWVERGSLGGCISKWRSKIPPRALGAGTRVRAEGRQGL